MLSTLNRKEAGGYKNEKLITGKVITTINYKQNKHEIVKEDI